MVFGIYLLVLQVHIFLSIILLNGIEPKFTQFPPFWKAPQTKLTKIQTQSREQMAVRVTM